jgi:hypothetical protein
MMLYGNPNFDSSWKHHGSILEASWKIMEASWKHHGRSKTEKQHKY